MSDDVSGTHAAQVVPVLPGEISDRTEQIKVRTRDGMRLATEVFLLAEASPSSRARRPGFSRDSPYDNSGQFSFMDACAFRWTQRGARRA